jgi:hypothetical protein
MFQRKYLIFLAALMLAALAWTAGWFWLENKLRNDIVGFVEAQAKNGMILDWSGINISGFPIRFSTSFKNPQAQWTIADRRVFWTGADISIRPFIEGPEIASFRSPGRHNFHILKNNNDLLIDINARDFEGRLYFDKLAHAVGLRGRAAPFTISLNGSPEITIAEATLNWARTNGATAEGGIYPDSAGDSISMVLKQIDLAALLIDPGVVQTLGTKTLGATQNCRKWHLDRRPDPAACRNLFGTCCGSRPTALPAGRPRQNRTATGRHCAHCARRAHARAREWRPPRSERSHHHSGSSTVDWPNSPNEDRPHRLELIGYRQSSLSPFSVY